MWNVQHKYMKDNAYVNLCLWPLPYIQYNLTQKPLPYMPIRSSMKLWILQQKLANPRKPWNSLCIVSWFPRVCQHVIITRIISIHDTNNSPYGDTCTHDMCALHCKKKMMMPSRYMTKTLPVPLNRSFTNRCNVVGEFERPNNITNFSNKKNECQKTILYWLPSQKHAKLSALQI